MGYFSFIPRVYRIALGVALIVFAIASVIMPVFGSIVTSEGEFILVPTGLVGIIGFFGLWLFVDGTFRATPPEEDLDFSHIPYADGAQPSKQIEPEPQTLAAPQTIEEKMAARKERLEKARREGKI